MRIRAYWTSGGVLEFDPETGSVSKLPRDAEPPDEFGSAWKQRGRWFVLWHDGRNLILQQGKQRWVLNAGVELSVSGWFRRTFRIRQASEDIFSFSYWFKGIALSTIDPTYDGIDEEGDDYFVYVTNMWQYWKDKGPGEFRKNWEEGLKHRTQ